MRTRIFCAVAVVAILALAACDDMPQTSNDKQRDQQEVLLNEATSQVGMPAIKNFRERKLVKDIFELRDQEGLITYTYLWNEFNGKKVFLCTSIGYGVPYATQFTNPEAYQRVSASGGGWNYVTLPQADPNGLFSPQSAEGTWVLCQSGNEVKPVYVEPRIIVSPFKME